MAVITTEKLGATVGAEVKDVDRDRLLHDEELPAACLAALEANGALVFLDFHIDGCTDDIPIMATMLSAHAVAESGGETEFASTYAAYDDLSDDEKERLASVRVVHTIEASQRLFNNDPSPEELAVWRARPSKEHPLGWKRLDGRRSLVLGATTDHVVGMSREEGRALLD